MGDIDQPFFNKETIVTNNHPRQMLQELGKRDDADHTNGASGREPQQRPYATPQLDVYGPIQALTLGGSIGAGESGMPSKKPLTGLGMRSNLPTRSDRYRNPAQP